MHGSEDAPQTCEERIVAQRRSCRTVRGLAAPTGHAAARLEIGNAPSAWLLNAAYACGEGARAVQQKGFWCRERVVHQVDD
eukprot:6199492-Pleurochrysis_carterae.AAC.2